MVANFYAEMEGKSTEKFCLYRGNKRILAGVVGGVYNRKFSVIGHVSRW